MSLSGAHLSSRALRTVSTAVPVIHELPLSQQKENHEAGKFTHTHKKKHQLEQETFPQNFAHKVQLRHDFDLDLTAIRFSQPPSKDKIETAAKTTTQL